MTRAVVWLCSLAAAAALGGAGVENEAPGAAVSVVPAAPPALARVPESSSLLRILPIPGRRRLRSFLEAIYSKIRSWFVKDQVENSTLLQVQDRRLQGNFPCRPSRRPGVYGVIPEIPPEWILNCIATRVDAAPGVTAKEIFGVNHQIVDISFGLFKNLEALMISQRRGPVRYIEVVKEGDYAHYEVNRNPLKTFRDHSCLNKDQWCFVSKVLPIDSGFLVVDRHRVIHYNYTWLVEGNTPAAEIPDIWVSQFGLMNADEMGKDENLKLKFPTSVAEYIPYNMTLVSLYDSSLAGVTTSQFEITPQIPHAWARLLFVTDTGNHRLIMLNASNIGQFDYLGQFGLTGEARANSTGFDWPWGVAVHAPAWEGRYEPAYANIFVADRRNHRLVKLNLGYPLIPCEYDVDYQVGPLGWDDEEKLWLCRRLDKPRLYYSAEYGRGIDNQPRGLTDPTAVEMFNHYIVVAEVGGNAITLLRVDHQPPYGLKLVTYFKPMQGVSLQGGMAVSPFGYVWYNYIGPDMQFYFSSMFLPEILRESKAPSRFQDFLETCVNISWYQDLIGDAKNYVDHMGYVLNVSVINWMFPDMPGYVDIFMFNNSGTFDINLLNAMVYNYTMIMCDPPTTPTPPPFFGGNQDGWVIDGKSQSEFTRRSGAVRSSHVGVGLITCCISALLLLVLYRP